MAAPSTEISALGRMWKADEFCCFCCQTLLEPSSFYDVDNQPWCAACYQGKVAGVANPAELRCSECTKLIVDSFITIKGRKMHRDCFVCGVCKRPILVAGNTYHEHNGMFVCEADFAVVAQENLCGYCNAPITDAACQAMGKLWHADHFLCKGCSKNMLGLPFYEMDGRPACEQCYLVLSATICGACAQPIVGTVMTGLGKRFHPACFVCTKCKTPVGGDVTFTERGGVAYCSTCFDECFNAPA